MHHKETYILNLFFGEVRTEPISFSWHFPELLNLSRLGTTIQFELSNTDELFAMEAEFEAFNAINKKQEIGHNPRAAGKTGILKVIYPAFDSKLSYRFTEQVNLFLQDFVSLMLTFFQRRRIIFGIVRLKSGDRIVLGLPPFLAGSLVDSIGYGSPLVPYHDTARQLTDCLCHLSTLSKEDVDRIQMLLLRYNETLNLPYTYERIESYWRILEALGADTPKSEQIEAEYQRLKHIVGVKRESDTLQRFVSALILSEATYVDSQVSSSFHYRNRLIHEYLSRDVVSEPELSKIFRFLNGVVERAIGVLIGLNREGLSTSAYTVIDNRVL